MVKLHSPNLKWPTAAKLKTVNRDILTAHFTALHWIQGG